MPSRSREKKGSRRLAWDMTDSMKPDSSVSESLALPDQWSIATPELGNAGESGAIAETIDTLLRLLASHGNDLRSLDGVTLAVDCQAVAAKLQKWPDDKGPLYRAETAHAIEMGRTVAVWRGTELRFHIVLQAAVGLLMLSEEQEDQKLALACLAHETAHVEHEGNLFRSCPHVYGQPLNCGERSSDLFLTVMDTWSEYAACRSSAFFRPESAREFDALFHKSIQEAVSDADLSSVPPSGSEEIVNRKDRKQRMMGGLFICAGYLFGHFDGLPFHPERKYLRAMEDLQGHAAIHSIFVRVHKALENLWQTESTWTSLDVFFPLYSLLEELIAIDVACWKTPMPFLVKSGPRKAN